MPIICSICKGALEAVPTGQTEPSSVCAARCGHVFHNDCLRQFWTNYRRQDASHPVLVPCPYCSFKHRPATFEVYLSTREITFTENGEQVSSELLRLRDVLSAITAKVANLEIEEKEKKEKLERLRAEYQEAQNALAKSEGKRDEAKKSYEKCKKNHVGEDTGKNFPFQKVDLNKDDLSQSQTTDDNQVNHTSVEVENSGEEDKNTIEPSRNTRRGH